MMGFIADGNRSLRGGRILLRETGGRCLRRLGRTRRLGAYRGATHRHADKGKGWFHGVGIVLGWCLHDKLNAKNSCSVAGVSRYLLCYVLDCCGLDLICGLREALENAGGAHAPADAHGHHAVAGILALKIAD